MFKGEESIRIRTTLPVGKVEEIVDDAIRRLGNVEFYGKSAFEITRCRYDNFASQAQIDGELRPGRKTNEWIVRFNYEV